MQSGSNVMSGSIVDALTGLLQRCRVGASVSRIIFNLVLALASLAVAGLRLCVFAVWWLGRTLSRPLFFWSAASPNYAHWEKVAKHSVRYEEWYEACEHLDALDGVRSSEDAIESPHYDWRLVLSRLQALRRCDTVCPLLLANLRAGLLRNLGGMVQAGIREGCRVGIKKLVGDYVDEVCAKLELILDSPQLSAEEKFTFFRETRQSFGGTALCLSGGATLGLMHLGVVRTLLTHQLLPRVISGSSVGSIITCMIGTRTDDELAELLASVDGGSISFRAFDTKGSFRRKLHRLLTKGVVMDISKLAVVVRYYVGDTTFAEAHNRTGRVINVTVASANGFEPPRLLNYLTAPNVLLWSAACASCALPFIYGPQQLMMKHPETHKVVPYHPAKLHWLDGSIQHDLPFSRMSQLFNIVQTIVSQVNPHVVPFLDDARPPAGLWARFKWKLRRVCKAEVAHRVRQCVELGLLPVALRSILSQTFEGDITIKPSALGLRDYLGLLSNPDGDTVHHLMRIGIRSTLPKLEMIMVHCKIEQCMDACMSQLVQWMMRDESSSRVTQLEASSSGSLLATATTPTSDACVHRAAAEGARGACDSDTAASTTTTTAAAESVLRRHSEEDFGWQSGRRGLSFMNVGVRRADVGKKASTRTHAHDGDGDG